MTSSSAHDDTQSNRTQIQAVAFGAFILVIPALSFVNRDASAVQPTTITACERYKLGAGSHPFTSRMMILGLANGQSISLDCFEYGVGIDGCLPIGTRIERHAGDVRYRVNGSRPTYWWYLTTSMAVLGALLLAWGAAGLWRLRKGVAQRLDFVEKAEGDRWTFLVYRSAGLPIVHALVLTSCVLAVWLVSNRVGGLQKYELMLASAAVAAVSASVGLRLLEPPWRRWMATTLCLDRSGLVVKRRSWRLARIQMPLLAIAEFAPSLPNPRTLTVSTSESAAMPLGVDVTSGAGATLLADRLNHALDILKQPHHYRECLD